MRSPAQNPNHDGTVSDAADRPSGVRALLLLSGAFLAVQALLTDYGDGNPAAAVLWFAVGCVLLWVVFRRRSRAARGVVIVTALVGAVVYGLASLDDPHAVVLALAFLGQAVPLMTGPVRWHVQTRA
ncbi:hypothetical protein [Petropleomorpha daqingensis]|uniref:Uncharacterized protein n=1 Tax=Petropleomorpha daqingensis TaxID=2026353 RepID=A0A853CDX1_9ACTN|nr:hypothetical protein [Petropleomorpha daqingensis]NYJ04558.1 hypothetical protein [Petropleomorpha daqingensis]